MQKKRLGVVGNKAWRSEAEESETACSFPCFASPRSSSCARMTSGSPAFFSSVYSFPYTTYEAGLHASQSFPMEARTRRAGRLTPPPRFTHDMGIQGPGAPSVSLGRVRHCDSVPRARRAAAWWKPGRCASKTSAPPAPRGLPGSYSAPWHQLESLRIEAARKGMLLGGGQAWVGWLGDVAACPRCKPGYQAPRPLIHPRVNDRDALSTLTGSLSCDSIKSVGKAKNPPNKPQSSLGSAHDMRRDEVRKSSLLSPGPALGGLLSSEATRWAGREHNCPGRNKEKNFRISAPNPLWILSPSICPRSKSQPMPSMHIPSCPGVSSGSSASSSGRFPALSCSSPGGCKKGSPSLPGV